ncbi:MAG: HEAT repeat domain-containing protein [Candidatus Heimdallarchaeota archaeon]
MLRNLRALSLLLDAIHDNLPELRARCAWALGELKDPQALDPLLALFKDPEPWVRITSIRATGSLGDTRATPILLEL